jgi:hypothetical protein
MDPNPSRFSVPLNNSDDIAEPSSFVRTFVVVQLTAMVGLTGIFVAVTRSL